jgi:uncharacterized membrane protein YeaQ/YmgE (transglycosylase-associated protein family)
MRDNEDDYGEEEGSYYGDTGEMFVSRVPESSEVKRERLIREKLSDKKLGIILIVFSTIVAGVVGAWTGGWRRAIWMTPYGLLIGLVCAGLMFYIYHAED